MLTRLFGSMVTSHVVRSLLVVVGLLGGLKAYAGSIKVDGHLPRNTATTNFQLTFTVSSISPQDYQAGLSDTSAEDVKFGKRLQIYFIAPPDYSSTNIIPAYNSAAAQTPPILYQAQLNGTPQITSATDGTYTFVYTVNFIGAQGDALKRLLGNNGTTSTTLQTQISVGAKFFLNSTTGSSASAETPTTGLSITQTSGVGNQIPSFAPGAAIIGSMNQLNVNWQAPSGNSIPTIGTGGAAGNSDAGSVIAYAFDPTTGTTQLPTFTYDPSAATTTTDVAGNHCTYTPPDAANTVSNCITCDDTSKLYYLDFDRMQQIPGFHAQKAAASSGNVTIANLVNGLNYTVFLQYDYPSVVVGGSQQCLIGHPSPNFTMTEINGESTGKIVDFRCFVATAAYGSPMHKDLRLFRKFRDRVLLTNRAGKTFVHYYYKFSPPLADFIAAHPLLRKITRGVLAVPAEILRETDEFY